MSKHFDRVIGIDPSAGMIQQARQSSPQSEHPNVEFRVGTAEAENSFLQEGEVDCVVVGTAAHWFDYSTIWPALNRLVRKDGTLAFWSYISEVFVDFPHASALWRPMIYGMDPERLGPYWHQPGESIMQDNLRIVQPPPNQWEDVRRIEYEPGTKGRHSGEGTVFVERSTTVGEFKEYTRTWSSYYRWKEAHPGREARLRGGQGDVFDEMMDELAKDDEALGYDEHMINIEWSSILILARKR